MKNAISTEEKVLRIIEKYDALELTGELLWRVITDDGKVSVEFGDQKKPFFIASATKLYVTAILAQLAVEGVIDWDQPIAKYLPKVELAQLSTHGGNDYGDDITIREIMAHTAGLPDYFEGKLSNSPTTIQRAIDHDFGWGLDEVLNWTRKMKPVRRGSGYYSDTGYQLLGALIEAVDGVSFADSVERRICEPLELSSTYVFGATNVPSYSEIAQMLGGKSSLTIPLAMASVQADGGIVSTVTDSARFLGAFFSGDLFPSKMLEQISVAWHPIFPPLEYGTGIMRFSLPALMTGFTHIPEFIGHSGASGAVMFRSPELGLTIVGTVNQTRKRSLPFELLIRCALEVKRG
ncbi:MAG: serine hydrolase domain-containing protein [Microbacteriaceae bacterium]